MKIMVVKIILPWLAGMSGLVVMDLFWIGFFASGFYRTQIGHLLQIENGNMVVNIPAALATWAVIVAGIQLFVVPRASAAGTLLPFMLWGALFGAVVYAVYDLTNYAVIKDWPFAVTIVDIAWGAVVCSMTSLCIGLALRGIARLS